jgi:hypothetical protein
MQNIQITRVFCIYGYSANASGSRSAAAVQFRRWPPLYIAPPAESRLRVPSSEHPTHKLLFFTLGYVTAVTVFKNSFALN